MKKIFYLFILFFIFGCAGISSKNNQKISDTSSIKNDHTALEVIEKITYMPSLTGFIIPEGIYLPVKKDKNGTYYQAPNGIRGIGLSFNHWPNGGILKKFQNDGISPYDVWYDAPPFGIMRRELNYQNNKIRLIKNTNKPIAKFQTDGDGLPHGSYRMINAFGTIQAVGAFTHGKMSGDWTFWDSKGVKIVEVQFNDDHLDGLCKMWYGSFYESGRFAGRKKLQLNFKQGKLHGERVRFYLNGNKQSVFTFNNNQLTKIVIWNSEGDGPKTLSPVKERNSVENFLKEDREYLNAIRKIINNSLKDQ